MDNDSNFNITIAGNKFNFHVDNIKTETHFYSNSDYLGLTPYEDMTFYDVFKIWWRNGTSGSGLRFRHEEFGRKCCCEIIDTMSEQQSKADIRQFAERHRIISYHDFGHKIAQLSNHKDSVIYKFEVNGKLLFMDSLTCFEKVYKYRNLMYSMYDFFKMYYPLSTKGEFLAMLTKTDKLYYDFEAFLNTFEHGIEDMTDEICKSSVCHTMTKSSSDDEKEIHTSFTLELDYPEVVLTFDESSIDSEPHFCTRDKNLNLNYDENLTFGDMFRKYKICYRNATPSEIVQVLGKYKEKQKFLDWYKLHFFFYFENLQNKVFRLLGDSENEEVFFNIKGKELIINTSIAYEKVYRYKDTMYSMHDFYKMAFKNDSFYDFSYLDGDTGEKLEEFLTSLDSEIDNMTDEIIADEAKTYSEKMKKYYSVEKA